MIFEHIQYSLLLTIIPLVIFLYLNAKKRREYILKKYFSSFNINENYKSTEKKRVMLLYFYILSITFVVIALMQPQWGVSEESVKVDNYNIAIALDLSESMNAQDIKPSRLEKSKLEIKHFLKNNKNISIALVGFAASSFIASPLTQDVDTLSIILDNMTTKSITQQGTRIADAINTAINTFPENYIQPRSIIVITDGEDHQKEYSSIIADLKEKNINIYGVSIGSTDGSFIPIGNSYKKDQYGENVLSKRNDNALNFIKDELEGKTYKSDNANIPFDEIFNNIKLSGKYEKTQNIKSYKKHFQIFIFISIIATTLIAISMCYSFNKK